MVFITDSICSILLIQFLIWRDVLRENARKKFEEARFEMDPEVITRLLIGDHDAVQSAIDELAEKQRQQIQQKRRRPSLRLRC
ncbi:hypothetical protein ACFX2I_036587 [Malus domestica]